MKIISSLIGLAGLYFTIFGSRVIRQKGFVEDLRKKEWKGGDDLLEKNGYRYDRYVRGIRYLVIGIIFLSLGIYGLLKSLP